jgi:CheY-like chemotaxis protein
MNGVGESVSAAAPRSSCARWTVVVVEDNRDGAETLAHLLRLKGYVVRVARDGVEGLDAIKELHPDAVLVDIEIPKINGYDLCRSVRGQPWGATTCMLAVTGWGQRSDLAMSRAAGFDLHLIKPVEVSVLLQALTTILGNKMTLSPASTADRD